MTTFRTQQSMRKFKLLLEDSKKVWHLPVGHTFPAQRQSKAGRLGRVLAYIATSALVAVHPLLRRAFGDPLLRVEPLAGLDIAQLDCKICP